MDDTMNAESLSNMRKLLDNAYNVFVKEKDKCDGEITCIKSHNKQYLKEIEKLKEDNSALRSQLRISRKELIDANTRIEMLLKRLQKERLRMNGWRKYANQLKTSKITEIDLDKMQGNNKYNLFESPVKLKDVNVYALAPMTEQVDNDDIGCGFENEELVGETERLPQDKSQYISSDNKVCDLDISPSIMPFVTKEASSFFTPYSTMNPEIVCENKDIEMNISADLFSDASPLLASTCIPRSSLKVSLGKSPASESVTNKEKSKISKSVQDVHKLLGETKIFSEKSNLSKTRNTKVNIIPDVTVENNEVETYKYVEVVRKKADREKLNGYNCHECVKYYESDNLTKEEMQEVLKKCSRHRHKTSPAPATPDDFWSVGFPTTQEYIEKGYMDVENKLGKEKSRKRIKYKF